MFRLKGVRTDIWRPDGLIGLELLEVSVSSGVRTDIWRPDGFIGLELLEVFVSQSVRTDIWRPDGYAGLLLLSALCSQPFLGSCAPWFVCFGSSASCFWCFVLCNTFGVV